MDDLRRAVPPATDKEVREYLNAHPELKKKGTHIHLRQILARYKKESTGAAEQRISEAQRRIRAGMPFEDVAQMLSDAPEASSGGSLGLLLLEELAEPIQAVPQDLPPRTLSSILRSDLGYHLFWIDDRIETTSKSGKELKNQVRELLERQKLLQKQEAFFSKEIYERHAVEKKL
jgi:parvulin-like peptidyl-prolyl isomerase